MTRRQRKDGIGDSDAARIYKFGANRVVDVDAVSVGRMSLGAFAIGYGEGCLAGRKDTGADKGFLVYGRLKHRTLNINVLGVDDAGVEDANRLALSREIAA